MNERTSGEISCNVCRNSLDGVCCRTSCSHLFCYQCASEAFSSGYSCPICGSLLSQSDVQKVDVGENQHMDITDTMFTYVLRNKDWNSIILNISTLVDGVKDITSYVNRQLDLDRDLSTVTASNAIDELKVYKSEVVRLNESHDSYVANVQKKIADYEEKYTAREKDFNDMKLAFKEKTRKSQAWEKAYNALRQQMMDGQQVKESSIHMPEAKAIPTHAYGQSPSSTHNSFKPIPHGIPPEYHSPAAAPGNIIISGHINRPHPSAMHAQSTVRREFRKGYQANGLFPGQQPYANPNSYVPHPGIDTRSHGFEPKGNADPRTQPYLAPKRNAPTTFFDFS